MRDWKKIAEEMSEELDGVRLMRLAKELDRALEQEKRPPVISQRPVSSTVSVS